MSAHNGIAIDPTEFNDFIDYLMDYYGSDGIFTDEFFNSPATREEATVATMEYLEDVDKEEWGGDSLDRERVRDIMVANRGNK